MNARLGVALAVVAAASIGAAGYLAGTRGTPPAPDRAAIEAVVKEIAAAEPQPAMSTAPAPAATQTAALSDSEQREVEAIIRNYLIANPEIIRDAINELQRKEDETARAAQASVITDNAELIFNSPRQAVLGNPQGDVTLVEFFDYNCGYCRRAHADMKRLIAEDPNLRVVLKEFPILGDGSVQAAQVAVALFLTAPDKYGAFHEAMLTETGQADGPRALAIAEELGVDPAILQGKMVSEEVKANIGEAMELAQKLDLTGTPSYVTRKQVVVGAVGYETLKQEIADARACATDAAAC